MALVEVAACAALRLMALHPGRITSVAIRGNGLVIGVARKSDLPLVPGVLYNTPVERQVTGEVVPENVRNKVISM